MATKLGKPHVTYIACTQCEALLYEGVSRELGADHRTMHWKPLRKGSYRPPNHPPRRCPYCEGSTIQKGMIHG